MPFFVHNLLNLDKIIEIFKKFNYTESEVAYGIIWVVGRIRETKSKGGE